MIEVAAAFILITSAPPPEVKFRTPSGNIGCRASFSPQPVLRCDITGGVKPLPPPPATCQLDWGVGFELAKSGSASLTCAGDTVMDSQARVIPAGTTWRERAFECGAAASSLRCANVAGHGFFLSAQRSYAF